MTSGQDFTLKPLGSSSPGRIHPPEESSGLGCCCYLQWRGRPSASKLGTKAPAVLPAPALVPSLLDPRPHLSQGFFLLSVDVVRTSTVYFPLCPVLSPLKLKLQFSLGHKKQLLDFSELVSGNLELDIITSESIPKRTFKEISVIYEKQCRSVRILG